MLDDKTTETKNSKYVEEILSSEIQNLRDISFKFHRLISEATTETKKKFYRKKLKKNNEELFKFLFTLDKYQKTNKKEE